MKRPVRLAAVAGLTLAAFAWALGPTVEYLFRSKTSLLIDQLLGHGCQFQEPHLGVHTLNPLTQFGIRHPDFVCPMWAADHLAAGPSGSSTDRDRILRAFGQALMRKPDSFDTGDGVLQYGSKLREARESVRLGRGQPR